MRVAHGCLQQGRLRGRQDAGTGYGTVSSSFLTCAGYTAIPVLIVLMRHSCAFPCLRCISNKNGLKKKKLILYLPSTIREMQIKTMSKYHFCLSDT